MTRSPADRRRGGPADRAEPGAGPEGEEGPLPVCERCGTTMLDRHCKVVCLNCGYMRDCSDP